jgi:purine nucleosidase
MSERAPTRVVIDCDTGVDDAMAILYGLLAPEIEIVGLTCCWGNIWVETATRNTLRLLEIVGRPDIPVAVGARKPLLGPVWELAHGVHGADGQGNTDLPPPRLRPVGESAAELIVRLAHEHPGQLTLVPVAPLTNVALALALDPSIVHLYKEVVLMGGSFLVPGNAAKWGEANIWHDPEAAQAVFEAGWPITAVGLDVTLKTWLTERQLDELAASQAPAAQHIARVSRYYLDRYAARRGHRACSMHDALALAIAADRGLVTRAPLARVDVELTGTHTRGMTVADLRVHAPVDEANAHVVLEVDSQRFVDRWMEVLTAASPSPRRGQP